jgi:hypothetical protein
MASFLSFPHNSLFTNFQMNLKRLGLRVYDKPISLE